ncbi:XRE family transcriptional regulator [Curtobacterium flaccumfaciens]|uniref:XRE family transcriptional regulator n=1 Tax=Curtobacterium flaccumfaciens TaxID=2035 RepID=UPI00188C4BB6|nr:XRE family transcriptional regulator [Curtobacterium flaccumfaciens]MBF4595684.1 XRE family transcriptional regulator [Curtobacterium flaccumfaciens]
MSESSAQALHGALAAELRAAQGVAHVNVRAWAEQSAITHDTIYRILNGKRPVTVVELVTLCHAIQDDPLEMLARAAKRAGLDLGDDGVNEIVRSDRARLALEAAGLWGNPDDTYSKARAALSKTGHLLSLREWRAFVDGTGSHALVVALADFLEVPADYLLGKTPEDEAQRIDAQLGLARSMRSLGVTKIAARSLDELQPEEMATVEFAIRALIDKEEGPRS